jgi:hypothetical protein
MAATAKIGFHAASLSGQESGMGNAIVGAYLNKIGLSYSAVIYITKAAPGSMTWLNVAEAEKHGIEVTLLPLSPMPNKPLANRPTKKQEPVSISPYDDPECPAKITKIDHERECSGYASWVMRSLAPVLPRAKVVGELSDEEVVKRVEEVTAPAPPVVRSAVTSRSTSDSVHRAILYEEEPNDATGKRYNGSVTWRIDELVARSASVKERAVRADIRIPERRLRISMLIRRNTDSTLPASHTVEIVFDMSAGDPFGGVSNVPGVLMKQAEQTRGLPLAGLAVKVKPGFFIVGLSAVEKEKRQNVELLRGRGWFDIPIVYSNGRRAILAIEKGKSGQSALTNAFDAWANSQVR